VLQPLPPINAVRLNSLPRRSLPARPRTTSPSACALRTSSCLVPTMEQTSESQSKANRKKISSRQSLNGLGFLFDWYLPYFPSWLAGSDINQNATTKFNFEKARTILGTSASSLLFGAQSSPSFIGLGVSLCGRGFRRPHLSPDLQFKHRAFFRSRPGNSGDQIRLERALGALLDLRQAVTCQYCRGQRPQR
jgi:hypothetical protein